MISLLLSLDAMSLSKSYLCFVYLNFVACPEIQGHSRTAGDGGAWWAAVYGVEQSQT